MELHILIKMTIDSRIGWLQPGWAITIPIQCLYVMMEAMKCLLPNEDIKEQGCG
jgi:hypothetical protein